MKRLKKPLVECLWGAKPAPWVWLISVLVLLIGVQGTRLNPSEIIFSHTLLQAHYAQGDLSPCFLDYPWLSCHLGYFLQHMLGPGAWALRLPSVLAGIILWLSCYYLARGLYGMQQARVFLCLLLSSFALITLMRYFSPLTFFVVSFYFSLCFYFAYRAYPHFLSHCFFLLLLSFVYSCGGMLAVLMVLVLLFPDMLRQARTYFNLAFFLACAGVFVFFAHHFSSTHLLDRFWQQVLLFLHTLSLPAFNHAAFVSASVSLLPWGVVLLCLLPLTFTQLQRWPVYALLCLWALGLCYGYPLQDLALLQLPMMLLITANALCLCLARRPFLSRPFAVGIFTLLVSAVIYFALVAPLVKMDTMNPFAKEIKIEALKQAPWSDWTVVLLDSGLEANIVLQANKKPLYIQEKAMSKARLQSLFPPKKHTIYVAKARYLDEIAPLTYPYAMTLVREPASIVMLFKHEKHGGLVAFISQATTGDSPKSGHMEKANTHIKGGG
jgi:hypothetical protein